MLSTFIASASESLTLWPKGAPGEKGGIGPEHDTSKPGEKLVAGKPVVRLGDVSVPTLTIFRPSKREDTGAAVIVCPGGGYNILAIDLEGTEVCDWLNSIGVTCILLKYRVPNTGPYPKSPAALEDAQRTLGLVRQHAAEWHIDPNRIGVLGFSAGAHLAAALSTHYDKRLYAPVDAAEWHLDPKHIGIMGFSAGGHLSAAAGTRFEKRDYEPVDEADQLSCRPDFTMLIYPAYLAHGEGPELAPELTVTSNTPPTFIVQTEDDHIGVENSLYYYLALKKAAVPAEMHLFPKGGHGYGLRESENAVTAWPKLAGEWMRKLGVLERKSK